MRVRLVAASDTLGEVTGPGQVKRCCVFCGDDGKISLEHIIPYWMTSGEDASRHLYVRESGGPDYDARQHVREGRARDLTAKGPCERCNNTWMNEMDVALDVLGPQLIRGRRVTLTKGKKTALAAWAVKYVLMCQLTHARDRRFAIPGAEYTWFHGERGPGDRMRLWAGFMPLPGKDGGPVLGFTDFSLDETYHDGPALERAGLSAGLASKDYSAIFRFGHCVVSLYRAEPEILGALKLVNPRAWVQIWPAVGSTEWPPGDVLGGLAGRVDPLFAGLPVVRHA
jgi:hypothetical protein